MLDRARNGYTGAQVEAALHASRRRIRFRYELYSKSGAFKAHLKNVRGGSVEYNAGADIKRTAKFEWVDTTEVDYLSDRVKPICRVGVGSGWAEFPLGLFLLSTTPRTLTEGSRAVMRTVEAYDLAKILVDDRVTTRYTVPAGAEYIAKVRELLEGAGITAHNLTPSTKTLPAARDWDPGTSKLEIINDLLRAIVYHDLWFDENGVAVAAPYISPAEKASEYTYKNDNRSVLLPDAEQLLDLWSVPNKWVLTVSESDMEVLRSEYTNTNPNSPTSTVSRGRTIVRYETVDAESQAALDAMVERMAFEDSQVYETFQLGTAVMPFHSHMDVLTLEFTDMSIPATRYEEVFWGFELKAGSAMKHIVRRIVTV